MMDSDSFEILLMISYGITMLFGIWGIILIVKAIAIIWKRSKKECQEARALREKVAAFCHNVQWCGWMSHLFMNGHFNEDGTWTMPAWAVERWTRQASTPYNELSENEKKSDRREADRILELMK